MALYMGKVKIAGSGSGGGGSYVLPEATSSTLGGVKVGMADTDEKLGVKLDPTTKQAYVTKTGGTGTCNYNYTQLSGTVEDIVEGNNTAIGNIVNTKLTANNTAIGTVVEGKLTTNNTAIGTIVENKLTANNTAIGTVVENKLTANNPTIQGYVIDNNSVLSSMISSIVEKTVAGMSSGLFIDTNKLTSIIKKDGIRGDTTKVGTYTQATTYDSCIEIHSKTFGPGTVLVKFDGTLYDTFKTDGGQYSSSEETRKYYIRKGHTLYIETSKSIGGGIEAECDVVFKPVC